ncbi:Crp/Fnr family transcriptional regulator (plasmid) [Aerococcus urinaeequi]|uniref:Crp/Fnr family transcriptional regulator n=1 Tax=Aerococcus urinaeequi TaxID=51665 RepID=A0AA47GAV6_9LACT|nr:Crp/Fnr family transcriptional regulator [Aerococcus urinaeequi]WAT25576.1 Crp/Fnr family transcriptional regulator [Aerococcus urinaeequi]
MERTRTLVNRDLELYMESLEDEPFFENFATEQMNLLENKARFHQYNKGQVLFFQSDPRTYSYYLLKGLVKLESVAYQGDFSYIDFIEKQTFFPYGSIFGKKEYTFDAIAATDIDIILIPNDILEEILYVNNAQLRYMYSQITQNLNFLEKRLQVTTRSSAYERVLFVLALWQYDMAKPFKDGMLIQYPLTMNELAAVAGTTRETASRVIHDLKEEGRISFKRKAIHYLDPQYFEDMLQ